MKIILISTKDFDTKITENHKNINNVDILDTIDCLIFHSSEGPDYQVINRLIELKDKVQKFIYIISDTSEKTFLYECIFRCFNSDIYGTEEYLKNDDIIQYIVDNYKNTEMTIQSPYTDISLLKKSIDISDKDKNKFWSESIVEALSRIKNIISQYGKIDNYILDIICTLITNENESKEELERLNKYINELEESPKQNTPFIYSTYKIPALHRKKILYVKDYGKCSYLVSFLHSYQQYLRNQKNCTSKLLLVFPKLEIYIKKYSHIPVLSADNIKLMKLSEDMYITFEPKKLLLESFFEEDVDIHIIIDSMFGDKLIEGPTVEEFDAISSDSDIKKFNLEVPRTISAIKRTENNIRIPFIKKYYKADEYTRRSLYFGHCSESEYSKLDRVLIDEI